MDLNNLFVDIDDDTTSVEDTLVNATNDDNKEEQKEETKDSVEVKDKVKDKVPENVKSPENNKEEHNVEVEEEEVEDNYAKMFAKLLVDKKVLENAEGIETFEDITKLYEEGKNNSVEEFISGLPANVRQLININNEGVDINKAKPTIDSLSFVNSLGDNVTDAKVLTDVFRKSLEMDGYSKEYIDKRIESAEDTGTLELEGNTAISRLKQKHQGQLEILKEEAKQQQVEQEKLYNDWVDMNNNTINITLKERYKLTPRLSKDIADKVFNPIEVVKEGGVERPVSYLERAMYDDPTLTAEIIYLIHTKKIGKDAKESIIRASKSKGIENLENALKKGNRKKATKGLSLGSNPMTNFTLKM